MTIAKSLGADLRVWAGFRTHLLLPEKLISTITAGEPHGQGIEVVKHMLWGTQQYHQEMTRTYSYEGEDFLRVKHLTRPHGSQIVTQVWVKALQEVWLQEPGLSVHIAGCDWWSGCHNREVVKVAHTSGERNPHRNTIHFNRIKKAKDYVDSVVVYHPNGLFVIRPSYGFTALLDKPREGLVPYRGASIFGGDNSIVGRYLDMNLRPVRRWELAAHPDGVDQFHGLGWTGGPGAVVNVLGLTPPDPPPVYRSIYHPPTWRRLLPTDRAITMSIRAYPLPA